MKKNWVIMVISLVFLLLVAGCGGGSDTKNGGNEQAKQEPAKQEPAKTTKGEVVPVYTTGSGGSAYILGGGIASIANKYIPDANLTAEATGGSAEEIKHLDEKRQQGKNAIAIVPSEAAYKAFNGIAEYKQALPGLRALNFLYSAELYLVVPENSPIKTFADVKGKRIGIGAPGSAVSAIAVRVIEESGVAKDQFKPLPLGYQEVVQGIKDGSIDGGILSGSAPIAAYNELSSSTDVRIVPVDDSVAQNIIKASPYFIKTKVKSGAYKGVDSDIPVLAYGVILITHEKADEEFIYNTLKTLLDKRQELVAIHKTAEQMTSESALTSISIPLHPGAEKYYKETGIMK